MKIRDREGSSLLVVLAFIVLLTVTILAFFSRSVLEEQISIGSANQVKTDNFAMGAIAATVSDLKQEVEAGSSAPTFPVSGNNYICYYAPAVGANANNYPTMLPSITGSTSGGLPPGTTFGSYSLGAGPYLNLVKISLHSSNFYFKGSGYSGVPTNPQRAAPISTGSLNDSSGVVATVGATQSADGTALNGRYISGTRWSKPLFIPSTYSGSTVAFPLPDWIYVYRTPGTTSSSVNPTSWNTGLVYSPTTMSTSSVVLGRYAYAIYDEGGLLNVNVAGSPTPLAPTGSLASLSSYKSAEALADLSQIGLTQTQIDTLIGWRNNASAAQYQGTGTSTPLTGNISSGYTWSNTNGTNYFYNVLCNPTGFLHPVSTGTGTGTVAQSDQSFTSRQQLLQFFNNVLGGSSSTSTVDNALQYLTTFSRSLEQPSYIPSSSRLATGSTANGGNNIGTGAPGYTAAYSTTVGAYSTSTTIPDSIINPPFLSVRVTSSFTRNDGSIANLGDPLVNKRFALSRLAWVTFGGPIADDSGNVPPSTYPDGTSIPSAVKSQLQSIVTALETQYGYSPAFLAQGGPTNVYKYFGLSFVKDTRTNGDSLYKWVYNHEGSAFSTSLTAATGTENPIRSLSIGTYPVASKSREADFFELLKASTTLGSLGKAYHYTASPSSVTPTGYQMQRDNSVDLQVVQIGANIMDQFQPSGYCERLLFTDGSLFGGAVQEIRGVEDLPYIYRVREGKIMVTDSSPASGTLPSTTGSLTSAGTVAVLQEPEIWNPHTYSSSEPDTNPRPTQFRIVAISADPNSPSSSAVAVTPVLSCLEFNGTKVTKTPTSLGAWTDQNTGLDFSIPSGDQYLFREPTLLIKPGIPTNSGLVAETGSLLYSNFGAAITSNWKSTQIAANGGTDNQQYIGFLAAKGVAAWTGTVSAGGISSGTPASATAGILEATYVSGLSTSLNGVTYRMQYQDAANNWVTYDEKYMDYLFASSYNYTASASANYWTNANRTFNTYQTSSPYYQDNIIGTEISGLFVDPRTSRFGCSSSSDQGNSGPNGYRGYYADQFPLMTYWTSIGWAADSSNPPLLVNSGTSYTGAIGQMALATTRPDTYPGWTYNGNIQGKGGPNAQIQSGPTALGWFPVSNTLALTAPGMLAQNNPAEVSSVSDLSQIGGAALYTVTSQAPISNQLRTEFDTYSPAIGLVENWSQFFADPDTVVRRGMAAYVPTTSTVSATPPANNMPSGIPTATSMNFATSPPTPTSEMANRPMMLNRPFRSVAELGYVFTGTPWRNVDMSTPESGSAALLDTFCINDTDDPNNLVEGKVNLNTRQPLVLQAILNGAYADEFSPGSSTTTVSPLSQAYATVIAQALVNRTGGTASGLGPLTSISDLVGRWNSSKTVSVTAMIPSASGTNNPTFTAQTSIATVGGATTGGASVTPSYLGFTSDPVNSTSTTTPYDLTEALAAASGATDNASFRIERYRDASIRALSGCGQTRVWNLMIDVIAQTGRFPSTAAGLNNFLVEGEQRYWVHVAIDRYTGQVLDQQIEEVKE